jgi:hypothetical protein
MVSRSSFRRWLLRDLLRHYMLLGCAAIAVSALVYEIGWPTLESNFVSRQQSNASNNSNEQRYTGSIILPMRGKLCSNRIFDNRTGRMVDGGNINCDVALHQFIEKNSPQGMDAVRPHAVSKAFRHEAN